MSPDKTSKGPWIAFSAALAATTMDLLDTTVIHTAAPAIRADLDGSYAQLQWTSAIYTLAMAVLLLTGGRLGDMFGRKRVLLVGAAGFTVASLVAALAPSIETLIVARGTQGALGAVMIPQVFGLIRDLFKPEDMPKAFGIVGAISGLAAIAGPIVGGLLIDADIAGSGWRMIFLINLPVGAYVIAVGARHIPDVAPSAPGIRLDAASVALASAGSFALVFPLVQGRELGWPTWSFAMLGASVVAFAAFARRQQRRARGGQAPLVEPSLFAKRAYVSGVGFAVLFLAAMGGVTLTLGVLLQIGLGFTPIEAALAGAPFALGGFVGSAIASGLMAKLGRTILQAGLVLEAAGFAGVAAIIADAGVGTSGLDLIVPLGIAGIGMGMVFVPLFDIVLAGVEDHEVGSASSVVQALQQLGMTLGIAAVGTLFFGLVGDGAADPARFVDAAQTTTLVSAGIVVAALGLSFLMPRHARAAAEPVAEVPRSSGSAVVGEPAVA